MSLKSIQMLKKIIFALLATLFMAGGILFYLGDKNNSGERNFLPLLRDKLFDEPKEPVNVIFCMTTLQMVIAEKIIEKYPNEKFYAVLISLDKNEKYEIKDGFVVVTNHENRVMDNQYLHEEHQAADQLTDELDDLSLDDLSFDDL